MGSTQPHAEVIDPLRDFEVILQGGCLVEAFEAPKHRALQECHVRPSSTHLRMDAGWRVAGIHQEASRGKPSTAGELVIPAVFDADSYPLLSCSTLQKASNISTQTILSTAISKGYVSPLLSYHLVDRNDASQI